MKLLVFLIILSVHMSMASKESIKQKISNVQEFSNPTTTPIAQISKIRNLLKIRGKNPNMFPATVEDLQLKLVSKFEYTLKKIEKNPNFGLTKYGRRFTIQLNIPFGAKQWYGSQYDHATARKAVLLIAKQYKKSLEAKSPATKEDLQQKYDAKFSKSQKDIIVSKIDNTLKKIERNPNFGLQQYSTRRYYVMPSIPCGERHMYGSHQDQATARKAVLMIVQEYKKSLEAKSPATKEDLQQKYNAMFPEIKQQIMISKFDDTLKKIEQYPNFGLQFNRNRIYVNVRIPIGKRYMYGYHCDHATARQALLMIADEYMKSLELETPATFHQLKLKYDALFGEVQKVYKIRRTWNLPEDEPEHDFYLGGYFKVMNPPDVLWVNTIKKVDGRLTGYYKEYGGCHGWVNLEYIDGPKGVNETLKRKREKSASISESEESTRGSDKN